MKWCPQLDKRIRYIPRCSWYVKTLSYRSTTPLNTFKLGIVLIEKKNFHFHNIPTLRLILLTMHKFLIYQNITFKSLGFLDLSMIFFSLIRLFGGNLSLHKIWLIKHFSWSTWLFYAESIFMKLVISINQKKILN